MNILVTGGAGYIGSHAVRALLEAGHHVVVVDDLSHGYAYAVKAAAMGTGREAVFVRANVADQPRMVAAMKEHLIEAVMHFAAFIEVGESVMEPAKYYRNNFSCAIAMLDAMREAGVKKLVFSSTAAVYGNPASTPILETAPLSPINPYGRSKMMVELALEDYAGAYGLGFTTLRYFNVAGASPSGHIGEAHEPETHLIPRILHSVLNLGEALRIYGTDYETRDGTCIRDFIHVDDLARAHVLALESLKPGERHCYNLGSEIGFSVKEVIAACSKVIRRPIAAREFERRPGDPAVLVASSEKIRKELGWERRYPALETIVEHAWNWHQNGARVFKEQESANRIVPIDSHFSQTEIELR